MTPKERLRALLTGATPDRLLIDVGTSTLTAGRPTRPPAPDDGLSYSDPVMHLPVLTEDELAGLGSHTRRCGPCFAGAALDDDMFGDRDGVQWIWADGEPAPLRHPMGEADLATIVKSRRAPLAPARAPSWLSDPNRILVVIADAPTAGILDTAFRVRGYYELLDDTVERWPLANALFDRATASILQDYRAMFAGLPADPDIVVYGDDLAHQTDLYLSEERFAFFVRPHLTRIFSTIRSLTTAEILFHSCGASLPVLQEAIALGIRIVNFQPTAAGMEVARVRRVLGPDLVFHGVLDFVGLAKILSGRDKAAIGPVVDTIMAGWPMIAAPADNLPIEIGSREVRAVTSFLENLDLPALLHGDRSSVGDAFQLASELLPAVAAGAASVLSAA